MFLINKEWQLSFIPIFLRNYFYGIKQILHTVLRKSTFAGTQEIAFRFCRNCFRQIIFSNFFFKYKIFLSIGRKINAAVSIRRFALCGFLIRLCLLFFFDRRCFTLLRIPIFSCGRKYFPLSARYSLKLRDFFCAERQCMQLQIWLQVWLRKTVPEFETAPNSTLRRKSLWRYLRRLSL